MNFDFNMKGLFHLIKFVGHAVRLVLKLDAHQRIAVEENNSCVVERDDMSDLSILSHSR